MNQLPATNKRCPTNSPFYFGTFLSQMYPSLNFQSDNNLNQVSKPSTYSPLHQIQQKNYVHQIYYPTIFSPHQTTESLKRRNQHHEMMNFQNSDSEEDEGCKKRIQKVAKLQQKEQNQVYHLEKLKLENYAKYQAFVLFMKFLAQIKEKVTGHRIDYYSAKTFNALINSTEEQLRKVTSILKRIYQNIKGIPLHRVDTEDSSSKSNHDRRLVEFLILPRFLISREKLIKLAEDEQVQKNFQFLIIHECLGHYNNQANKKMPEPIQMSYIRQLMKKNYGYERFKKICSINHGNKFLRKNRNLYFELYSKTLGYLRYLDTELKKKRKYEDIKDQLHKFHSESESYSSDVPHDSSQDSSSSSNNLSFGSMAEVINQLQQREKRTTGFVFVSPMRKKAEKLISLPLEKQQQVQKQEKSFKLKKSHTGEPIQQFDEEMPEDICQ